MFKHTRPYALLGLCLAVLAAFWVWRQIPTYSGALDAYAKQVLQNPSAYGIIGKPQADGYTIYNIQRQSRRAYTGILAVSAYNAAANQIQMHAQPVLVQKNGLFWQVQPQEDFQKYIVAPTEECNLFPVQVYAAEWGDFRLQLCRQIKAEPACYSPDYNPHAKFRYSRFTSLDAYYIGSAADKGKYTSIAVAAAAMNTGQERPQMLVPIKDNQLFTIGGEETIRSTSELDGDWPEHIGLGGGGMSSGSWRDIMDIHPLAETYAVDLYLNGQLAAELTLLLEDS